MTESHRFFEGIAGRYDRAYALSGAESRARVGRVVNELAAAPGKRVLDLGVGTGRELTALLDADLDVVGLDLSPRMIAIAGRRSRPVRVVEHDFWQPLPFDDRAFDAAIALHGSLAHAPSEAAAQGLAAELARVLAPGGVFVAELPSHAWLDALTQAVTLEDRRVRRIAPDRCVYEDLVAGVSIEAWIPDDARWIERFTAAGFRARHEALGPAELLLVAHRPTC